MSRLSQYRCLSQDYDRSTIHTSNSMCSSLPSIMTPLNKTSLNLPQIRHPLSVRGQLKADEMDIKGSRCSSQQHKNSAWDFDTPRSANHKKNQGTLHQTNIKPKEKRLSDTPFSVNSIPEGVEVTFGDSKKIRLPVFGNASKLTNYAESDNSQLGRMSHTPSRSARLEVDEIEMLLRNRVNKQNLTKIKKRFKDNDPDGKGYISWEALHRIILILVKKVFSQTVFVRLLKRLGLSTKSTINVKEFWRSLHSADDENSCWFDPIQRQNSSKNSASSHRSKLEPDMKENTVPYPKRPDSLAEITEKNRNQVVYSPRKLMAKHKKAMNIEKWLKLKFREGFRYMKQEFENRESEHKGLVTFDQFLKVLSLFGLRLEKSLLSAFLYRCRVKPQPEGVPYRDFLQRFQDRGEAGITHKVLADTKHRFHKDPHVADKKNESTSRNSSRPRTSMSSVEARLVHHFQKDFLLLLGILKSCDVLMNDSVPAETFRKILRDQYGFDFSDNEFSLLMENLPLDKNGDIKYVQLLKQFDTRCSEPSLFREQIGDSIMAKDFQKPIPPPPKRCQSPEPLNKNGSSSADCNMTPNRRSQKQLYIIIQDLINKQYRSVEQAFYELDEANSGRLTQEMMYHLLKKFDIKPKISRGEIRSLWEMCITNMDYTLDYYEFVRYFSFSQKTASYPNAKICPPVKGDSDFMMRSNKLNCASDMLRDGLRAKIDYMWEDLQNEFLEMDPYHTGFVSKEEFQEVLIELCPRISDYELGTLAKGFQAEADERISYVQFLKPFVMKRQPWRYGKSMFSLLHQTNSTKKRPAPQKESPRMNPHLRNKLTSEWKNLRQAFHKLDKENTGVLPVSEFNSVLKKANIVLNSEEKYRLMNKFDENLSGKIAYNKFLKEIILPGSKQSAKN